MRPVPLSRRVVEVLADRGDASRGNRFGSGTGCLVSGRTILTAAHVVANAGELAIRDLDKRRWPARLVEIGDPGPWRPGIGPDMALLEIPEEGQGKVAPDVPRMGFATIDRDYDGGPIEGVRAIGYPWAAERKIDEQRYRVSIDALGHIAPASRGSEGLFEVQVTTHPAPPLDPSVSPWAGFSGAPVVINGRLVGIVTDHPRREGDNTLIVTPLTALQPEAFDAQWASNPMRGDGVKDSDSWWTRLGARAPEAFVTLPPRRDPPYIATLEEDIGRPLRKRMGQLEKREAELAALVAFASGDEPYQWLVGDALAGKTALMYEAANRVLPTDADVVCYFLSQRAADANSDRFLQAVVPQLEVLCQVDAGDPNRDRFRILWKQAERNAVADDRPLVLVVDAFDEDLRPPGLASVAALLPSVVGDHAHVLVSSRAKPALPSDLPAQHPLRTCRRVELVPYEGSADTAETAEAEIRSIAALPGAGFVKPVGVGVLGLLLAAGGPLTVPNLVSLLTVADRRQTGQPRRFDGTRAELTTQVATLLSQARSVEPVGPADAPRFQFAHQAFRDYAASRPEIAAAEHRECIHEWASEWLERSWPAPAEDGTGTPQYLLAEYPSTLVGEAQRQNQARQLLVSMAADIGWVAGAIAVVGVDQTLGTLRAAAASGDTGVVSMLAVVAAQAPVVRRAGPTASYAFVLRQLCLQAMEHGEASIAEGARDRLVARSDADLVPRSTTVTGQAPTSELGIHASPARALTVLPDGRVISGHADGQLLIWDPAVEGLPLKLGNQHSTVQGLVALDDGRVVTAGGDGQILLWDPEQPQTSGIRLGAHDGVVTRVVALADGRVASASSDGSLRVWQPDAPSSEPQEYRPEIPEPDGRRSRWEPHWVADTASDRVALTDVVSLTDGRLLVFNANPSTVEGWMGNIWDPSGLEAAAQTVVLGPFDTVVAPLPDGCIAVGGPRGVVRVWGARRSGKSGFIRGLAGDGRSIDQLAALRDGRLAMGCGSDGRVRVWNQARPSSPAVDVGAHNARITSMCALGEERVVTGGSDGRIRTWDVTSPGQAVGKRWPRPFSFPFQDVPSEAVTSIVVLIDGRVVTGSGDGRLRLWNPTFPTPSLAATWRPRWGIKGWMAAALGCHPTADAMATLPDGRLVILGSTLMEDTWLAIINPEVPDDPVPLKRANDLGAGPMTAHPDGRLVTYSDGRLLVWDVDAPEHPTDLGAHAQRVQALAALSGGGIVTGDMDGGVHCWPRIATDIQPVELGRHDGLVSAIAPLPDGRVVTGGKDGRLRIWEPAGDTGVVELGTHIDSVRALAVLCDGRVISGGSEGRVCIWDPRQPGRPQAVIVCQVESVASSPQADRKVPSVVVQHDGGGWSIWSLA